MANKGAKDSDATSVSSYSTPGLSSDWENEKACVVCNSKLSKTAIAGNKRFGCKFCGHAVCGKCSPNRELHPETGKAERICNECYRRKGGQDAKVQLEETLAHACSEIERLDAQLQSETRAKQEEQVARHRKELECEELKAKIFGLSAQLAAAASPDPLLQAQHVKAQAEIGDLHTTIEQLQARVSLLERTSEDLKTELDCKKTELIKTLTELTETKGKLMEVKETEMQLKTTGDELARAAESIGDLKRAKAGLQTTVEALQKQVADFQHELGQKSTELLQSTQTNSAAVSALERRLSQLQSENSALALQVQSLQQDHSHTLTSSSTQQQEIAQLKQKLLESAGKVEQLQRAREEAEALRIKVEKDNAATERMVASKIEQLQKTIQDFTELAEEQRVMCEEKQEEIDKLSDKMADCERKLSTAEIRLATSQKNEEVLTNRLQSEGKAAREKAVALESALAEKQQHSTELSATLQSLREQLAQVSRERDSLQQSMKSLQGELSTVKNSTEEYRQQSGRYQQEAMVLSDKLGAAQAGGEAAQRLLGEERNRHLEEEKALRAEARKYADEVNELKREHALKTSALAGEKKALSEKVAELTESVSALTTIKAEKARQDVEFAAAQERIRALEEMQVVLERRHNDTLDRLKTEADSSLSQLEALREDKIKLTADLAQAGMTVKRWEERVAEAESERNKVQEELEDLHRAMSRGENEQIRSLSSEIKELQHALNDQTQLRHSLEGDLQRVTLEARSLQAAAVKDSETISRLQGEAERLKGKYKEKDAEALRTSQELQASKEHVSRLNAHLSELKNSIDIKEIEFAAKIKKMSEGGSAEIQRLEEQVQNYRQESVRLEEESHRSKVESTRKQRDLESQLADLSNQLHTANATISTLQREVSREKEVYERDKATALELMDSMNEKLKENTVAIEELAAERDKLQQELSHTQQSNQELTDHLTQERVSTLKKEKEIEKVRALTPKQTPAPAVVEDVEEMRLPTPATETVDIARKTREQNAAIRRITAVRGVTKTMTERELEAMNDDGFRLKRKGSDPSARDACRCTVF